MCWLVAILLCINWERDLINLNAIIWGLWTLGTATHTHPARMPHRYQMACGLWHLFKVFAMFCLQHFSRQYFLGVYHGCNGVGIPPIYPPHVSKGTSGHVGIWWRVFFPWLLCSQFHKTLLCLCQFPTELGYCQTLYYHAKEELGQWTLWSWPRG